MSVICGCGTPVETKPEWAGQWISCPACGSNLYAPHTTPGALPPKPAPSTPSIEVTVEPAPAPATRLCPWCSETIPVQETTCRYCKEKVVTQGPGRPPMAATVRPAPPLAPQPPRRVDNGGVGILVCALIGWLTGCLLLCPIAWLMGSQHESRCRAEGIEPSGAATAGKIIGIIGSIFLFLMLGFFLVVIVIGAIAS